MIELIVVIALFGILFLFTLPKFDDALTPDPLNEATRWFMNNVRSLRDGAVRDRKTYILRMDIDAGRLWVAEPAADDGEEEAEEPEGHALPDGVRILDLERPDDDKTSFGVVDVRFHEKGYSDLVLIHLEDDDHRQRTLRIRPFLPTIRVYDFYAGFED